jgi:hypothetical protein
MRGICMSGLTSGDWKRSNGPRLRHRQKAKAAGRTFAIAGVRVVSPVVV